MLESIVNDNSFFQVVECTSEALDDDTFDANGDDHDVDYSKGDEHDVD